MHMWSVHQWLTAHAGSVGGCCLETGSGSWASSTGHACFNERQTPGQGLGDAHDGRGSSNNWECPSGALEPLNWFGVIRAGLSVWRRCWRREPGAHLTPSRPHLDFLCWSLQVCSVFYTDGTALHPEPRIPTGAGHCLGFRPPSFPSGRRLHFNKVVRWVAVHWMLHPVRSCLVSRRRRLPLPRCICPWYRDLRISCDSKFDICSRT